MKFLKKIKLHLNNLNTWEKAEHFHKIKKINCSRGWTGWRIYNPLLQATTMSVKPIKAEQELSKVRCRWYWFPEWPSQQRKLLRVQPV